MAEVAELNIDTADRVNVGVTETIAIAWNETGQDGMSEFGVVKNVSTCSTGEGE